MTQKQPVFAVTPELQQKLDSLPANEPRSRLEVFRPFILRWRREGRSYRRIQQILATECHTKVSFETLRRFVNRRTRPRKVAEPDLTVEAVPQPAPATHDPFAEARARMRRQKAAPAPEKPLKLFEYTEEDAMKPIVFRNSNEKEK